jgi:hypothetical protein
MQLTAKTNHFTNKTNRNMYIMNYDNWKMCAICSKTAVHEMAKTQEQWLRYISTKYFSEEPSCSLNMIKIYIHTNINTVSKHLRKWKLYSLNSRCKTMFAKWQLIHQTNEQLGDHVTPPAFKWQSLKVSGWGKIGWPGWLRQGVSYMLRPP